MTDIQAYIASGIIEAYYLGQLETPEMQEVERIAKRYPEIRAEIDRTDAALRHLTTETPALRDRKENIMRTLHQLQIEQTMSLDNLPLLSRYSNHRQWLEMVRGLEPQGRHNGADYRVLQETPNLVQTLIWLEDVLEEDGHDPEIFQESILVLDGKCECKLGSEIVRLGPGGFLAIPANTPHIIRNIYANRPLLGIMQRFRVAA